ncbi:coniferyl-alcohol dehydrogenase [Tropicibacter sp. Alg240-R139]|uniref:coniferyl-alcohol dehydrogenase n=1 Tax=Tropicibacter sp. Alg240-R139 TaxID=2305991 RepID=UPI0013DF4403|nr:coniferyl-alcohol dehydrogenase [Tropicibacter sp. Alg240-R139]
MLTNKKIIVTGCASGIGAETARLVKELGGTVIGIDRNETTENVDSFYKVDFGDKASIDALVQALPDGVDGLANIAGVPPTLDAETVVRVNLIGVKYFTLNMIDKLADGASIVNLASLAGLGWPNSVEQIKVAADLDFDQVAEFVASHDIDKEQARSYFFAKEALVVWTMQHRWTWRDRGIRVNAISPGAVETPILKDFLETLGKKADEARKVMDRAGTPKDIAPVVAFLLSDMTPWIRGVNIAVDGGQAANALCGMNGL